MKRLQSRCAQQSPSPRPSLSPLPSLHLEHLAQLVRGHVLAHRDPVHQAVVARHLCVARAVGPPEKGLGSEEGVLARVGEELGGEGARPGDDAGKLRGPRRPLVVQNGRR